MTGVHNNSTESIRWFKDWRPYIKKLKSQSLYSGTVLYTNKIGNYDAYKDLVCFQDKHGAIKEFEYERTLEAQRISDANKDKEITGNEVEIYKAIKNSYGKPVIGGVTIDTASLSLIKGISKDDNGVYTVNTGLTQKGEKHEFEAHSSEQNAKIELTYRNSEKAKIENVNLKKG